MRSSLRKVATAASSSWMRGGAATVSAASPWPLFWFFERATSVHLEVREQALAPALAAEAALLVAAERRARIELVVGVRPNDACLETGGDPEALRALVGPDARR